MCAGLCGGSSTTNTRQLWLVETGECWFQVLGHQAEVGSLALSLVQPHLSAGSAALLFLIHI